MGKNSLGLPEFIVDHCEESTDGSTLKWIVQKENSIGRSISFETLRMKALLADRFERPEENYKTTKSKPKDMEFKPSETMTFTYRQE